MEAKHEEQSGKCLDLDMSMPIVERLCGGHFFKQ